MQTNKLFEEGGMLQEGGTVDPVSGNDVPVGSLQEEVRDDLDVKLSEGEFVIPADVVRYIGLERLMKLRDEAKKGLARMAEIGQMGNAQEVENPDALHGEGEGEEDDDFEAEIDDIIQEVDGEAIGAKPAMNMGGMVRPLAFADGGAVPSPAPAPRDFGGPVPMLSKYGVPTTSVANPALDVRVYRNQAGSRMFVTFINGKPLSPIPAGYTLIGSGEEYGQPPATPPIGPAQPPTTSVPTTSVPTTSTAPPPSGGATGGGGGDAGGTGGDGTTGGTTGTGTGGTTGSTGSVSIGPSGVATGNTTGVSNAVAGLAGMAASVALGIPGLSQVAQSINNAINNAANAAAAGVNAATADTMGINADTSTAAATAGPSGTGGNAAAAASAAASAATADGHSAAAAAAAGQAAANAAVSGMSVSDAISVGLDAAQGVTDSEGAAAAAAATAEGSIGTAADDGTTAGVADAGGVSVGGDGGGGDGGSSAGDGGGPGSCVDPLTPIYITETITKQAGDIVVGDTVFTVHEKTLEYGSFKVVAAEIIKEPKLLVTFDDKSEMKVSDTHKFLLSDGSWKEMYLLDKGAQVQTMRGINAKGYKTITNIEEIGDGDVVMLTVEEAHTYIADGLISHNMKARGGLVQRKNKSTKKVQKGLAARK